MRVITPSVYNAGFTLVELIITMVLVGVMAINVLPAMFDQTAFFARGFHDETMALLRYAQKSAIAKRRTVCVTFSNNNTASLTIANLAGASTCDTNLTGVNGDIPAHITAKANVNYADTPINFNFDTLGRPIDEFGNLLTTQVIRVNNTDRTITVESSTGYIHE